MDILRCIAPRLANDDPVAIIVPFQNRTRTDAEPLADLGRNRNLTLCGELRMSKRHGTNMTMVMRQRPSGVID